MLVLFSSSSFPARPPAQSADVGLPLADSLVRGFRFAANQSHCDAVTRGKLQIVFRRAGMAPPRLTHWWGRADDTKLLALVVEARRDISLWRRLGLIPNDWPIWTRFAAIGGGRRHRASHGSYAGADLCLGADVDRRTA
jgi:hypothetical protein